MKILKMFGKKSESVIQSDELKIISKCISEGDVVFDIGANRGAWSEAVVAAAKDVELHLFEAATESYKFLKANLSESITINRTAVSHTDGNVIFHTYRDDDRMSSIYRRISVEESLLSKGFDANTVPAISLDSYWKDTKRQINFIKIDVEGAEYDVLRGANKLLKAGRVDFIQFEYGGTYRDAGFTLQNVWSFLRRSGYIIFLVSGNKFVEVKHFHASYENYKYANFIAVHGRLRSNFVGIHEEIKLSFDVLKTFGVELKGVLHVGAHKGQEIRTYRAEKLTPIVLVEANPELAKQLRTKTARDDDIFVVEGAASDRKGVASFNIATMDQSSSLLPLGKHSELYPKIKYTEAIDVRTITLDEIISEIGIQSSVINFLVMDIQGAELLALKGASNLLNHIQAVQTEINYEELYEGSAHVSEIDAFLKQHGLIRVRTVTPYHKSWGDAVYVKSPMIINSKLGSMGRFGNKAFQYMFLSTYAAEHNFLFSNHPWEGDDMFNVQPGSEQLPSVARVYNQTKYDLNDCTIVNSDEQLANADLQGYFQYNMKYYAPYRSQILAEFENKGVYLEAETRLRAAFRSLSGPVAVIHLRCSDYGTGIFFRVPNAWYLEWLRSVQMVVPNLKVYIATDDEDVSLGEFGEFDLISSKEFDLPIVAHDFFYDFTAMRICDYLGIANSSFSFLAAALNQTAISTVRPDPSIGKMISFNPWESDPLIRTYTAEGLGEEFMSERAKTRSKYRRTRFFKKLFSNGRL